MSRINKDNGLLFLDGEGDEAMLQSVRDRLLVRIGNRAGRPEYGSILPGTAPADVNIAQSVRDALASDQQIVSVEFQFVTDRLLIDVNHRLRITV